MSEAVSELEGDVLSHGKKIGRIAQVRDQATKESNRFFVISVIFVGLYLVRAAGLKVDLTLFNAHVLGIPYGLFFFLLASQISICLSLLRLCDSVSYKRRMLDIAVACKIDDAEEVLSTFPDKYDWFGITAAIVENANGSNASKFVFGLSALLTSLFAVGLLIAPIVCGVYFLVDSNSQIIAGNRDLQYWAVFASTVVAALWFANYIVVYRLSTYTRTAE